MGFWFFHSNFTFNPRVLESFEIITKGNQNKFEVEPIITCKSIDVLSSEPEMD